MRQVRRKESPNSKICHTRVSVDLSLFPPQLSELPTNDRALLDARHHDLEPVEVIQRSTARAHGQLAAPGAVGPFLVHLGVLVGLLEHLLRRRAGELGDGDVGQRETLEVYLRADHVGRVDERAVLVDDVHDHHELAILGAVVDERHPPDLHKPAEHHGAGGASHRQSVGGDGDGAGDGLPVKENPLSAPPSSLGRARPKP
jgi:hypothetical protein